MGFLDVEQVRIAYDDTTVVDDVSFGLDRGQVLAVLGPSGCGKSTLLRGLAGLEPLVAGRIGLDGTDVTRVPTHKRGFALMFQEGQLFAHLDVARNIGYPLRLRRRPAAEVARRVGELLDLVGLPGTEDRLPASLSGGERQRVALARALAVEPRLLLLDEPLSALDATLRQRLAGELRDILRTAGTTAILVTHDHEEAFAVADRLAVMREGRLVQEGAIEEVWAGPADAETALFLGYAAVLTGSAADVVAAAGGLDPVPALAVRRSALLLAEPGPGTLNGVVVSSRTTPEQVRLVVDTEGAGRLEAVAPLSARTAPGDVVHLRVDPERTAALGERPRDSIH